MDKHWKLYAMLILALSFPKFALAQMADSTHSDRHAPVYHVNYWVSVPIILAGGAGGLYWVSHPKSNITDAELASLDPNNVPFFDRISLHQNMALVPQWDKYASAGQIIGAALPLTILLDPEVRPDWLPVITIGLEVNMVALGIYALTPLGPHFIDRYRPLNYYPASVAAANGINQHDGFGKDSWYSGHVASVAASSFFVAKVYCDYHADANRYLAYGLASVPPLAMGVIRFMTLNHFPSDIAMGFAVGTACGILIPQLHRIDNDNVSMGFYSSPEQGTGVSLACRLFE